jgi:peptide/nickel transport system substrate-binding protein
LFNAFRTGEIDVAYKTLDPNQVKNLQDNASQKQWQIIDTAGTVTSYMALNTNLDPVKTQAVRQAIALMVDRQLLIERVLLGQGEPLYSMIPNSLDVYQPAFKQVYGNVNVEKAKQLLQAVGFSESNPAIVEIWYPSGSVNRSYAAAIFKAFAQKKMGGMLKFEPNSVEGGSFYRYVSQGIYQSSLSDWYPDFLDADNYVYPFLDCAKGSLTQGCQEGGSQSQGSFYYNPKMNQLIDQQRREQNPKNRQEIFAQIQTILAEDAPYIPLWQSKDYAFAQSDIQGVTINPSQTFPFRTIQKKIKATR